MKITRRLILAATCAIISAALTLGAFAASSDGLTPVRSLDMNIKGLTLKVDKKTGKGEKKTLRVSISPGYADDKTISWSSSDSGVATVTPIIGADGTTLSATVEAIDEGKASIKATSGNGKTTACLVTVTKDDVAVRQIEMSSDTATVRVNQTRTLFVDILPLNADNIDITWTTSNPEIVRIEPEYGNYYGTECTIIGVSPGTAVITAESYNGKLVECKVTVPSTVLTGIEQTVDSKDLAGQASGGELLSVTTLRLDMEKAIKENEKAKQVTLTYSGKTQVTTTALRSVSFNAAYSSKTAVLRFRTLDADGKIQGQLTVNPQYASSEDKDIRLAVYTSDDKVGSVKERAAKHFGAPVSVVRLSQTGSFGMSVQVAAKTDLSSAKPLKVYRYYGGAYSLIQNAECNVDANGYARFTATEGGTYVLVSA